MSNQELSDIDVSALRNLYKSNPAARLVLDSLAARQKKSKYNDREQLTFLSYAGCIRYFASRHN